MGGECSGQKVNATSEISVGGQVGREHVCRWQWDREEDWESRGPVCKRGVGREHVYWRTVRPGGQMGVGEASMRTGGWGQVSRRTGGQGGQWDGGKVSRRTGGC
jgi:hypothetical protein